MSAKIPTPLERARLFEHENAALISAQDRPVAHLTPLVGWMNDPNGFCWYDGRYHLFYQYHPYNRSWGPMHWGHATTTDLLHWNYEPCAMAPDTPADAAGCFSGNALTMPDGRLMLIYTGVQPASTQHSERQAQCVAFGDGVNFEKCADNPVVTADGFGPEYSRVDFRDPKVWWGDDGWMYMVAGIRHAQRAGTIVLFRSHDGLSWEYLNELDSSCGEYGQMWECPDFFPLDGSQVLLVSPQEMRAVEEFHAGYGTVALLGSYDPESHRFERRSLQPVDHGLNFYAPQTLLSPDGRRIMIAWMENWETCKEAARLHPWYTQMTLPRELSVENGRLYQRPIREVETLWRDTVRHEGAVVCGETRLEGVDGRLLDMDLRIRREDPACRRVLIRVAVDARRYTEIRCDLARGELTFDRSHSGSCRDIAHTRHVKAELKDGELRLRVFLDREGVELFINDGERAVSSLIQTDACADGITFSADAPARIDVTAHHIG